MNSQQHIGFNVPETSAAREIAGQRKRIYAVDQVPAKKADSPELLDENLIFNGVFSWVGTFEVAAAITVAEHLRVDASLPAAWNLLLPKFPRSPYPLFRLWKDWALEGAELFPPLTPRGKTQFV